MSSFVKANIVCSGGFIAGEETIGQLQNKKTNQKFQSLGSGGLIDSEVAGVIPFDLCVTQFQNLSLG